MEKPALLGRDSRQRDGLHGGGGLYEGNHPSRRASVRGSKSCSRKRRAAPCALACPACHLLRRGSMRLKHKQHMPRTSNEPLKQLVPLSSITQAVSIDRHEAQRLGRASGPPIKTTHLRGRLRLLLPQPVEESWRWVCPDVRPRSGAARVAIVNQLWAPASAGADKRAERRGPEADGRWPWVPAGPFAKVVTDPRLAELGGRYGPGRGEAEEGGGAAARRDDPGAPTASPESASGATSKAAARGSPNKTTAWACRANLKARGKSPGREAWAASL
jgi:hypothetical protein